MQFAQVIDGRVVDLRSAQTALANMMCGDAVESGWAYIDSTKTFSPAVSPPAILSPLTSSQVAAALAQTTLNNGLNITSTSTPSLNGNYALTTTVQANINSVITYIMLNSTFPNNATTKAWSDSAGISHIFPSVVEFKAFATAIANFMDSVLSYGDSGGTQGAIPANNVTIA